MIGLVLVLSLILIIVGLGTKIYFLCGFSVGIIVTIIALSEFLPDDDKKTDNDEAKNS
jgi:hypothetical protein